MKIVAMVSALVLGAVFCDAADAQTRRARTSYSYVFAEYDYLKGTGGGGSLNGGGLGAGLRLNRFLGVQGGGQYYKKSGSDFLNGYIEGLLILPLGQRLSVHGAIGGAYGRSETSTILGTFRSTGGGYRAGVGMEYWLAPQWSLRADYRRQNAVGVADNIGVGFGFRF